MNSTHTETHKKKIVCRAYLESRASFSAQQPENSKTIQFSHCLRRERREREEEGERAASRTLLSWCNCGGCELKSVFKLSS